MTDHTLGYYSTADLRAAAHRRLPKGLFEFMDRGNDDEVAMRDNVAVMQSIKLNPRVLTDVSVRHQEITLFGKKQAMPVTRKRPGFLEQGVDQPAHVDWRLVGGP